MTPQDTAKHFGWSVQTIYQWISNGKLIRGYHYLKVGNRVKVIREQFLEFMREQDKN